MTDTPHLGLPQIEAAQAQKHVTHNEALFILDALVQLAVLDRDLNVPPGTPADGQRWIVKASPAPTGAWTGRGNAIARWQDGAWQFATPQAGWIAYAVDEGALLTFNGTAWIDIGSTITALQNLALLGIGTTADATNPFSAKLNNALWTAKTVAEGGDGNLRYKLSKQSAANTLSLLFQDNFSGRAEIGLAGDDDFHFKTSPDGSTWSDALVLDRTTGAAKLASALYLSADLTPSQITADQNDYGPAGLSAASVLRLSSDASRNITGLAGGGDGRVLALINVGANPLWLKNAHTSSTAANRFDFGVDLLLNARQGALICYDATDSRWKLVAPRVPQRELLTADRTYYVATTGSDNNGGLTAGAPFLTILKAINVVFGALDLNGFNVAIQVADGTYSGNVVATSPQVGAGTITLQGNSGTPANVVVNPTGKAVTVSDGAKLAIKDMKLAGTTGDLYASRGGAISFQNIVSAGGSQQIRADDGGRISATGGYTIAAGGLSHWITVGTGLIRAQNRTITLTGTPAFTTSFADLTLCGCAIVSGNTFSGLATGPRYTVTGNSVLYTAGAATTYLPGDSAGSTTTGGQYI